MDAYNGKLYSGSEDQQFIFLIQDSFLTQHVLELTREDNVIDIVLSSQKELVDNIKIKDPLGNSEHIQILLLTSMQYQRIKIKKRT